MEVLTTKKIREEWSISDAERDQGLKTPSNIKRYDDISYGNQGVWNLCDIYHETSVTKPQPTIINIHGGGWVYGTKEIYQFYCMDLAQRGFTVVNFNYRLAPEDPFPAALVDINNLFIWVADNAEKYQIDLKNLFAVGDSAGAQLASQYLTLLTSEAFRTHYTFQVPYDRIQIKGVALNCGMYDLVQYTCEDPDGTCKEYLGEDMQEKYASIDTMKYLNADFPPAYVMTSYYDFLREKARPMFDALTKLGILCEIKEYGSKEQPEIAHVFHVNIKSLEAKKCNDDECEFFKKLIQ